jgi:DNA-directed RNA polymerase subunit H (RpoH/RPB5)
MEYQGYNVSDYSNFSINEVNTMYQNKQLDMLLEKKNADTMQNSPISKTYICYYLTKTIRPQNIQEMIDDLFMLEEVLTKNDTLFIIIREDINDTLMNYLKHIWEKDKIFIVVQSIKRLQFNILKHVLVPEHRLMNSTEVDILKKKYNITDDSQLPDISRFDPVAQSICLRPGDICEIKRPSKTAIQSLYYRICIQ